MTEAATAAQPRLRVFAGPNGSGKSTIQERLQPEWIGVYVNADDMEREMRPAGTLDLNSFDLATSAEALQERMRAHLAQSVLLSVGADRKLSHFLA